MPAFKRSTILLCSILGGYFLLLPLTLFAQSNSSSARLKPILAGAALDYPTFVSPTATLSTTLPLLGGTPITVAEYAAYLPLVITPFEVVTGQIKLVEDDGRNMDRRARGVTTFISTTATLDFGELQFSQNVQPEWLSVSGENIATITETTFHETVALTLNEPLIGANPIEVQFRYKQAIIVQPFTLFYIPNGDFQDNDNQSSIIDWNPTVDGDPWVDPANVNIGLAESALRLGSKHPESCRTDTDGHAQVTSVHMDLLIPANSNFQLRIEGTLFTQDQNPSNNDTYDAFEVLLDGDVVERFSNQEPPINCNDSNPIERELPIAAHIALHPYAGVIELSLENHLRFDNFFNTYTEIEAVWIDNEG